MQLFILQTGAWATVSQLAKDLVADMLHIAPQRRPTASQLVKHPWLNTRIPPALQAMPMNVQSQNASQNLSYNRTAPHIIQQAGNCQGKHLKETVAATFRAIATSPQVAHLGPVVMSELARRRFKDKAVSKLQQHS